MRMILLRKHGKISIETMHNYIVFHRETFQKTQSSDLYYSEIKKKSPFMQLPPQLSASVMDAGLFIVNYINNKYFCTHYCICSIFQDNKKYFEILLLLIPTR